jgi:hypothetical protein
MSNLNLFNLIANEVENLITQNPKAVKKFKKHCKIFYQHARRYLKEQKKGKLDNHQQLNPLRWEIEDKLSCYYATLWLIYEMVKQKAPFTFNAKGLQKVSASSNLDNYINGMLFRYATSAQSPYGNTGLDTALKWVKADLASKTKEKKKSIIGKILKIIVIIIGAIITFLGGLEALHSLGWLEPIKEFIFNILLPK